MRKKLPIGIDGFEKLRTNEFYYVDKTMLISEIIGNMGEVNLFTRPRRFGKSLNMSMLKSFFEAGADQTLFDGLKISEDKELCEKYMGKYPVISISLKGVDALSFDAAKSAMRAVIGSEAKRFSFLDESDVLDDDDKSIYRGIAYVKDGMYQMSDDVLNNSLKSLSYLLSKHYGSRVITLIDEYDVPLDKAFQAGYYDEMVNLIRNIFGNALKTNDSLFFAVLTGCLRISKESIFTGLNNLKVHTISDTRYDEFFGFTDEDVNEILDFYELTTYKDTIKDWYDGYLFGGVNVYCPWDVINYCDELLSNKSVPPQNYWANTSGNELIRRLLKKADQVTKDDLEALINGEVITKSIRQELTYRDIDDTDENIWSVLYSTGYLTGKHVTGADADIFDLWIPNGEIRKLFAGLVKEWFTEMTRADSDRINTFCSAFADGDTEKIQDMLNDYLWDSISIRDTAVRKQLKENFYHGMLLGLLQSHGKWGVKSNYEAGVGFSDILIRTPERLGIVIEVKYAHDGNLEEACADALAQIEEKKYDKTLEKQGMKRIKKYGIAFYMKECMVVSREDM